MGEVGICLAPAGKRKPECLPEAATSWPYDWREATLARLEAWIEERERLIAELERRIEEEATAA